jgi:hypothetical protein
MRTALAAPPALRPRNRPITLRDRIPQFQRQCDRRRSHEAYSRVWWEMLLWQRSHEPPLPARRQALKAAPAKGKAKRQLPARGLLGGA